MPSNGTLRSATISVLVENESGVLARVIGLFSGRGYNIDSLTVAPVERDGSKSRITIVTQGTEMVIEQIKASSTGWCRSTRCWTSPRGRIWRANWR